MQTSSLFSKKSAQPSLTLPLTFISLEKWILITVTGIDAIQQLHNQLTCDVKNLKKNQYSFAAHCNATGKMISNMYVFYLNEQKLAFIEPVNIYKKQISIMKKYAIFSNINIEANYNTKLIGIAGLYARKHLKNFLKVLPDQINKIVYYQGIILLHFNLPTERFLLIINNELLFNTLIKKMQQTLIIQYNSYDQWVALDIEAGYPCIDIATSEQFFPQAAHIDKLQGISFDKGCYLGQELISRIQHYKLNKQSLYQLTGQIINHNQLNKLPESGDQILLQKHQNTWKKVGTILQSCKIEKNKIWIQAILNNSYINNNQFRIHDSETYYDMYLNYIKK